MGLVAEYHKSIDQFKMAVMPMGFPERASSRSWASGQTQKKTRFQLKPLVFSNLALYNGNVVSKLA